MKKIMQKLVETLFLKPRIHQKKKKKKISSNTWNLKSSCGCDISLNNRAIIHLPRKDHIIKDAEKYHRNHQHTGVVHVCSGDRGVWWPKAEEEDEEQIRAREDVDEYSERTAEMPRAPDQAGSGRVGKLAWGVGCSGDPPCTATVKNKDYREEVAKVKAGDGERYDDIETER